MSSAANASSLLAMARRWPSSARYRDPAPARPNSFGAAKIFRRWTQMHSGKISTTQSTPSLCHLEASSQGMLDTSTVILLGQISDQQPSFPTESVISAITLAELFGSWHMAARRRGRGATAVSSTCSRPRPTLTFFRSMLIAREPLAAWRRHSAHQGASRRRGRLRRAHRGERGSGACIAALHM